MKKENEKNGESQRNKINNESKNKNKRKQETNHYMRKESNNIGISQHKTNICKRKSKQLSNIIIIIIFSMTIKCKTSQNKYDQKMI